MGGAEGAFAGLVMRSNSALIKTSWAAGTGASLIRFGALLSAVAGIFDVAQSISATKRTSTAGDVIASRQHAVAGLFYGAGAGAFTLAVAQPYLIGPLGAAIILTLIAYSSSKRAETNESDSFERWVKLCYFGMANENPRIHWDTPEWADIAFAELNAATLGLHAKLNFESTLASNQAAPKLGGLINLTVEYNIKFRIILPKYSEVRSAYLWSLTVH